VHVDILPSSFRLSMPLGIHQSPFSLTANR
jgi:hypothetical protein